VKKTLLAQGVEARKENRLKRENIAQLRTHGLAIDPLLFEVTREPDKNPTAEEIEALLGPPELQQALQLILDEQGDTEYSSNNKGQYNDDININLGELSDIPEFNEDHEGSCDSDFNELRLERDSSESEISVDSNDSIKANADFISFEV